MHQRDVTVPNWVLALLWYPSLCLLSKESDPPRPLEGLNPQREGGPSCEWFTSARNLRCDRSLPLPQDCPQYIPKGKPTPASKLAFVIMIQVKKWIPLMSQNTKENLFFRHLPPQSRMSQRSSMCKYRTTNYPVTKTVQHTYFHFDMKIGMHMYMHIYIYIHTFF